MESLPIYNILVSVTDKTDIVQFITELSTMQASLQIVASGSSAKHLKENGLNPVSVANYTGFEECFSGRVKTLHPKIAGGILLDKDKDLKEARKLDIEPFDMVICNLYDFKKAKEQKLPLDELIEYIDIGGPTLIRSAAKNFKNVAILTSMDDYFKVLEEIKTSSGCLSLKTRTELAERAFKLTAEYETLIASEFSYQVGKKPILYTSLHNQKTLRYGENPDQKGWLFQLKDEKGIAHSEALSGKELSYNNYEDATIALNAVIDLKEVLDQIAVAVVKHGSLCGLATANTVEDAFKLAWSADSKSAFGSVIAINEMVEENLCNVIKDKFIEVIVAKSFSNEFINWVKKHKSMLRLIVSDFEKETMLFKKISGGMLAQTPACNINMRDIDNLFTQGDLKKGIVTNVAFPDELKELTAFSLIATKYVKSNAIVICKKINPNCCQTIGIGSGQPNRVDSMELLAIPKAIKMLGDITDCVLASDGFFPFSDSIDSAKKANIKWVVQPGGSKKDVAVIEKANEYQMGMIFTGKRFFSH